ncbi:restriction endonuclease subunit S [Streptomyces sp. MS1.AVA.3]|uniref:restriction endonuclease subunit S n=1 Tax=Streptomyces decoyicus TaxID=249567 RepID=UPI0030BB8C85
MTEVLGTALPKGWTASRLKRVTSLLNRGSAPDYVDDGPVRAISQAANQPGGLDWARTRFHDAVGDPRRLKGYLLPEDILINSTGTGTLGRIGYFQGGPDEVPCMADAHVTVARAIPPEVDSRFLYYWLSSIPFQEYIYAALVVGATNQIELNRERLGDAPVPLPPAGEQRRISDFLDGEVARVNQMIALRLQQLSLLDERKFAYVSEELVPGGLAAPLGRSPWTWLPEIAPDWRLVRLGYVARLQNGLTVDGKRDVSGDSVTRPYLRVANVQAGFVALDSVSEITVPSDIAKRSTLRPGDVLMTEGGDLDKLGRGTVWHGQLAGCLHQNHVFAIRPDARFLDGDYLAFMTQTLHGRCYFESTGSKTTNLASTNSSKILSFPIPLPSLAQQRVLVQRIQEELEVISASQSLIKRQFDLLAERRRALITAAVTGQIDVTTARGVRVP